MYGFCLGWNKPRVELYFGSDRDKAKYKAMHKYKADIERGLGKEIIFEKMDSETRIKIEMNESEIDNINGNWKDKSNWDFLISWFSSEMVRFQNLIHPFWLKAKN